MINWSLMTRAPSCNGSVARWLMTRVTQALCVMQETAKAFKVLPMRREQEATEAWRHVHVTCNTGRDALTSFRFVVFCFSKTVGHLAMLVRFSCHSYGFTKAQYSGIPPCNMSRNRNIRNASEYNCSIRLDGWHTQSRNIRLCGSAGVSRRFSTFTLPPLLDVFVSDYVECNRSAHKGR